MGMIGRIVSAVINWDYYLLPSKPYRPPSIIDHDIDDNGYPVIRIRADDYIDAASFTDGTTYPGDMTLTINHISGDHWEIHIEPWNTSFDPD